MNLEERGILCACFQTLSQHLFAYTETTKKSLSVDSAPPGEDSNPIGPDYEADVRKVRAVHVGEGLVVSCST
jgi:hypothetical protein